MNHYEYRVVDTVKAKVENYPDWNYWGQCEYGWAIYLFENEKPIKFIGCDGGEPEDQLLVRDWKWVVTELNHALKIGRPHVRIMCHGNS